MSIANKESASVGTRNHTHKVVSVKGAGILTSPCSRSRSRVGQGRYYSGVQVMEGLPRDFPKVTESICSQVEML